MIGVSPSAACGGRISTAVLRRATHWDEVVASLGLAHVGRHDLRATPA